MKQFQYYAPTKVIFGKDTQSRTGELVKEFGGTRVLIHYGSGSAVRSGLIGQVKESLDQAGITYVELGGVKPNPRLSLVREGIALGRQENVDFILAVGGGSVIDSSKAIAYGLANEGDVWDFHLGLRRPKACLPVGAVLTIAAAGSEMSKSCVITNEEGWLKRGNSSDLGRCRFAVMNPELTYTLSPYQTACGCVDIIMHIMERYFTPDDDTMITDFMAEGIIRTVMYHARLLKKYPTNYNSRAQVMWAGSLAHNGLLSCGVKEDWASHQLSHELSGMFDVAHGAGISAVWGSWARYAMESKPGRFAQFATQVLGIPFDCSDEKKTALAGIEMMEQFFRELDMPVSIRELGIDPTQEQIRELAKKCSFDGKRTIGGIRVLDRTDMERIYKMALG